MRLYLRKIWEDDKIRGEVSCRGKVDHAIMRHRTGRGIYPKHYKLTSWLSNKSESDASVTQGILVLAILRRSSVCC